MAINIKFTAQEQEVIKSLRAMGDETSRLVDKNIALAQGYAKTDAAAKFWSRGIERQTKELSLFKDKLSDVASTMIGAQSGIGGMLGGALGGIGGVAIGAALDGVASLGKEVVNTTEKYNRLQMALDTATGSATKGAEAFGFVANLARQTGLRIDTLAESYKGFVAASKDTKLEGKETERIFTSVVKAGAAMQLSNEQVQGTLLALAQMMSKGNVQAEELRGQLSERLPGAFNILAREMGVTTSQLNDLLKEGKVLAEDALPKLANGLDKVSKDQYSKNLDTITGAMNNFRNELDLALVSSGRESNINSFFASLINGATKAIPYLEKLADVLLKATPGLNSAYLAHQAGKGLEKSTEKFRPISASDAMSYAASTSLTEQRRQLDKDAKRLAFLKKASDPKKNIATSSAQLKENQLEYAALTKTYTERAKAYNGELLQRKAQEEETKKRLGLAKEEQKSIADLNKEVKELAKQYSAKQKANRDFADSTEGKALEQKISDLNKEKQRLQDLAKTGLRNKADEEAKAVLKELKEIRDETAIRLAEIKNASLDSKLPVSDTSSIGAYKLQGKGIESVVAESKGGYGDSALRDKFEKQLESVREGALSNITTFQEDLNTWMSGVYLDPSKIQVKPIKDPLEELKAEFLLGVDSLESVASDGMVRGMQNIVTNGFSAIKTAIDNKENPFKAFGNEMVGYLGDMMIQLGTAMLSTALPVMLGLTAATGGLMAPIATKVAVAAGGMMTTGGLLKAVKFANGGIVSGRTFAEVGEYQGARGNPEIIAPLNKLATIFTPFFQKAVDMGAYTSQNFANQSITTTTHVYMDGKVLMTQLDRTANRQRRI